MMRFAGAADFIKSAINAVKPSSLGDAAMRFGPDLFMAGLAAANAPEGTEVTDRALIGLEDAGIGLGSSLLMGGLGRATGRRWFKNLAEENPELFSRRVDQAGIAGDVLAMAPTMLLPRPAWNSAVEKAIRSEADQEQFQQQAEQGDLEAHLLAGLMQGSALLPTQQTAGLIL